MAKDDEYGKATSTAKSVRSNGHSASGGHTSKPTLRQNSAFSRTNRFRWDYSDGVTGDNMTFQYQEYPKHVYNDPQNPKIYVVCLDAEQERKALGNEEIIDDETERKRLLTLASVKNVQVDKRWGPAKITKAIEDAGFDPTLDPFK